MSYKNIMMTLVLSLTLSMESIKQGTIITVTHSHAYTHLSRDDLHMWLAPFLHYNNHQIKIIFKDPVTIAMIRIWVS